MRDGQGVWEPGSRGGGNRELEKWDLGVGEAGPGGWGDRTREQGGVGARK